MSQRPDPASTPVLKGMFTKFDKKKLADVGMAALVAGLKGAKAVLDTSSVPGASAVFSVILSCIDEAQKASRNADILKAVRAQVDAILEILKPIDATPESQQDQDISQALKKAAIDLAVQLSKRAEVVEEKTTHAVRPSWMTRGSDEEALQDFMRAVEDALKQFQISQGNRIERYLETIKQQTSAIRDDVEVIKENTREIKRRGTATEKETTEILHRAQAIEGRAEVIDESTAATFRKVLTLEEEVAAARERDWDTILRDLRRAPLASYNAKRPGTITTCAEHTRVKVLQEIDDWAADPGSDRVYWLKERAGYGKTAIAISVAERAADRGELAASFFFSHQVPDLSNASLLFPTIAFQLAQFDQGRYQKLVAGAIKRFPDAAAAKLNHQSEALLVKPLQQAQPPLRPLVIVVDALDECSRDHATELVDILVKASQTIPVPIRLIITSRPEHHLITAFKAVEVPARTIVDTSHEDVERYLRKELADLPHKLGLSDLSQDWISEEEIVTLVHRADGLFVYASTALRFIGDPVALNPRKRLKILLVDDEAQSTAYQPYGPLDRLYQRILDLATSKQRDLIEEVHVVLGARIVIYGQRGIPASIQFMARLLAIEVSDIRRALVKLQSVVVCPETDRDKITFHHASFKDFLLDSSRSGSYFIDTPLHHCRLAIRSFQIVVQSPFGQEVGTTMALDTYIPDPRFMADAEMELQYAASCAFYHASNASKSVPLRDAFDTFFRHGSLWWLENLFLMFHTQNIVDTYAWRIAEGNPPDQLIVLNAFGSLLSPNLGVSNQLFGCYAFARKALRRYFQISSQYPEALSETDSKIGTLHRLIRQCINSIKSVEGDGNMDSDITCAKTSVAIAEELEVILDNFMLSMGNSDEVEASHRHIQNLMIGLRDDFLSYGLITDDGHEALEPRETSTKDNGANDASDGGATGEVSEAVQRAGEQGDLLLGS